MLMSFSTKISKIVLLALIAVTVIVAALFFLGGYKDPTAEYLEPNYTSALLFMMYAFVCLAIVLVLVDVVIGFVRKAVSDLKGALRSLIGVGVLCVILLVTYFIGDGGQVNVLGLDEVPSQSELRLVDMQLYTTYVLLAVSAVLMVLGGVAKKIK